MKSPLFSPVLGGAGASAQAKKSEAGNLPIVEVACFV